MRCAKLACFITFPLELENNKVKERPEFRTACCCSCTIRAISCETGIVCSRFILPCMNRR